MRRRPVAEVLADLEALRAEWKARSEELGRMTQEEEEEASRPLGEREQALCRELPEEEVERLYPGDVAGGVLGINGLARWFQVHPRTIYRWTTERGFPARLPCGRWDAHEIEHWLDEVREPVPDNRWRGDRLRL